MTRHVYAARRHRVRLAVILAWAALLGHTVDIETSSLEGTRSFVGVERR